ncbi:MAG: oligoendopeptidase F, partial [Burkholderiales bacterium]|nr:oligoendopeptidase F [Burkholderiales bacterium]
MQKYLVRSLIAVSLSIPAISFGANVNDVEAQRWNLKDLYPSAAEWDKDASHLEQQLTQFGTCSTHLSDSVQRFKSCMDLDADILKRYARLSTYASQFRDQDTGENAGQDLYQRADILGSKLESSTSFLRPEILSIGDKKIQTYLKQDKSLAIYAHPLDDILRSASHTLDKEGEELIASFGMATNTAGAVYSTLSNADMPWPKVKLSTGEEVVIDQSAYTKYRAAPNRADRKLVFDAFWGKWKEFERTYGVTFYEQLKRDAVYAKVRHYPDSLTQALDGNKLPRGVYDTLVSQTQANLPTLHRYFKLRAKMLGVKELRYYDIYPPLVTSDLKYPITEGVKLMLDSVKPL